MKKTLNILIPILAVYIVIIGISNRASAGATENSEINLGNSPNIIVIYTDDQRWDSLCLPNSGIPSICSQPRATHPMPFLERVAERSIVFENSFATNPNCCPARASFLSGGFYPKYLNILDNNGFNGSVLKYNDSTTLGTELQANGYKTVFLGRYLNGYNYLINNQNNTAYIPPGWSSFKAWYAKTPGTDVNHFVIGSSTPTSSSTGTTFTINDYQTDILGNQALETINNSTSPFFLYLNFSAPHFPPMPPPRHQNLFTDFEYHDRGWGEADLSDKPVYINQAATTWPGDAEQPYYRANLAKLRAVDEAIQAMVVALRKNGQLNNTVIIFTSDQGFTWGEHQITDKHIPYEESIRTPLIIYYPGVESISLPNLISSNTDIPATIMDIAGLPPIGDGVSLVPLINNPAIPWRNALFFDNYDRGDGYRPSWTAIRTQGGLKYIEHASGEKEFYILSQDPFELNSRHDDPTVAAEINFLANRLNTQWNRGISVLTENFQDPDAHVLPPATAGQPYNFQFEAWGGDGSYTWSYYTGTVTLPGSFGSGLAILEPEPLQSINCQTPEWATFSPTGLFSGTPPVSATWTLCIGVVDGSVSPQPGNTRPMRHNIVVTFQS